jgi:hypothetical protein
VDSNGIVTQAVVLKFRKKDVVNAGKTISDFQFEVEKIGNVVVANSILSFQNSHNATDEVETYGGEKVAFSNIVTYTLSKMDPQIGKPKYEWQIASDNDTITCTISLRFLTIYAYYYFHDVYPDTPEDDSNKTTEDHAFYVKKITESKSPFYDLANDEIAKYFISYFGEDKFNLGDMKYSFCYSTPDTKLYSDATEIYTTSSGNIVHQWNFTAEDLAKENGGVFHTYTIKVKAYMWYMLALIISLSVALALVIYVKVKENNKDTITETDRFQNDNV